MREKKADARSCLYLIIEKLSTGCCVVVKLSRKWKVPELRKSDIYNFKDMFYDSCFF